MIKDELRKARRALQTADVDLKAGDGAASVNRSYYAMYYGARAMLLKTGVEIPKTHSAANSHGGSLKVEYYSGSWAATSTISKNRDATRTT